MLFTWLGEAQLGRKNSAQALLSFQRAAKVTETDVQYDDIETGAVTVYVRVGDSLLLLNRLKDAEQAYTTAQAKAHALSKDRRDTPTLSSLSEAQAGMASLWLALANTSRNPEDRESLRNRACKAFNESVQARVLAPTTARFSPNEYPVIEPIRGPELRRACDAETMKPLPPPPVPGKTEAERFDNAL